MKKRNLFGLVAALLLGVIMIFGPSTASAKPGARVPPACIQRTVGPLHLQVGYCP